jgi:Caspase domain
MLNESLINAIKCVQEKCCWVTAFALAGVLATVRTVIRSHLKKKKSRRSGRFPIRFTLPHGADGLISSSASKELTSMVMQNSGIDRRVASWLLADLESCLAMRAPRLALCVGIDVYSDKYGGGVPPLTGCADDAIHLAAKLHQLGFDVELLTDEDATVSEIKTAIKRLGRKARGVGATIMYFHSGHGYRGEDDPKAIDEWDHRQEALVLHDAPMSDDTLAELVSEWPTTATAFFAFDTCHSAGLGPDLMRRPGPTLFLASSEEDATSLVAGEYHAGGYLSAHLIDTLDALLAGQGGESADGNADGILTVGEVYDALLERWPTFCRHRQSTFMGKGRPEQGRQWPAVYRTASRKLPLIGGDR